VFTTPCWHSYWCHLYHKTHGKGEQSAELAYKGIASQYAQAEAIYKDEEKHEETLYKLIEEEKLSYLGSIVLV